MKNSASSVINQLSDCSGTRTHVGFSGGLYFLLHILPFLYSIHTLLYKNAWKESIRFGVVLILLCSACLCTKEIQIHIYLLVESNHFSNNTFINSRKQCIPNELHIFC